MWERLRRLNPQAWTLQGLCGKPIAEIVFPTSVAPGAQVWFSAYYFNHRKQSGPASDPITTYLQGGPATQMA